MIKKTIFLFVVLLISSNNFTAAEKPADKKSPIKEITIIVSAKSPIENSTGLTAYFSVGSVYLATVADGWFHEYMDEFNKKSQLPKNKETEAFKKAERNLDAVFNAFFAIKTTDVEAIKNLPSEELAKHKSNKKTKKD